MKDNRGIQGGPNRRRQSTVLAERRVCNSLHTRTLFGVLLAFCLFAPPARAADWTAPYRFLPGQSTITQTGGIAGINRTYTISGTFLLTEDFGTHTARFAHVDAKAVDDTPQQHTLDVNDVFNMTELSGVWIDGSTYRFNGIAHDGSNILVTLTFYQGKVILKGETMPPPNSADFFTFTMDAQAVVAGWTFPYRFRPGQSTLTQTGGIAGINRTYTVSGTFLLTFDSDTDSTRFDLVNAKAVDDSPNQHTLDPNEVFNMTGLVGTVLTRVVTRFEGTTRDGSSVVLTLTDLPDGTFSLKGETTPPPNSADFFVFALDAVAEFAHVEPPVPPSTGIYVFDPNRSTVLQTGGLAGLHTTYSVKGQFQFTDNWRNGLFGPVDAKLIDEKGNVYGLSFNEIFNLAGKICDMYDGRFVTRGKSADGTQSDVELAMTVDDGLARLTGQVAPPPNSADMFSYTLDAVAQRKYSGGTGEPNDPYQIATAADLIALGNEPNDYDKHFILTADIDLDPNLPGGKVFDKAVIAPDTDPNDQYFEFQGTPFTGVFDGNGHTISHLTVNGGGSLGLFGILMDEAEVRNVRVIDVNIAGSDGVGGLVGENLGNIATSYSTGSVSGKDAVGGLAGYNGWNGTIVASYSSASVNGKSAVGGLVGVNTGSITTSYSTGTVSGYRYVGGLVGYNESSIRSSYSSGSVSGDDYVGGLVGRTGAGSSIVASYSSGSISSTGSSVGGLVGYNAHGSDAYGPIAIIARSFWDIQTSGQTTSAGGTGKTTAEMQTASTFLNAGWDFVGETANGTEDIWWILEGKDYPRLSWQLPADDFEDGKAGPLWMQYEPQPEAVHLREVNGRLEVEAIAQSENVDAIYVADGWRLDTTKDFAIQVDFHFSPQGGGNGRVTFGVVPSLDPSAMQWAELEAGCFESGPFYLYEVRDGSWVQEVVADRSSDGGTLYISYDPDADELYLSYTGFGKANNWRTVKGLLKGRWASVPVSVILSGGSQGIALTGVDAWMDNFAVSSGVLVLN